jgi:RHS repeat-associated protein
VRAIDNGTTERRFILATADGTLELPILVANASGVVQQAYVYEGDVPLMRADAAGNLTFYLEDAMGSVVGLAPASNPSGSTTTRLFYDGFGNTRATNGPSLVVPAGAGGDFGFHGAWMEAASGLYFMHARDYHPHSGRFLSRDPVTDDLKTPESLHPYAFALNNPHVYSDRDGKFSMCEITLVQAIQFVLNTLKGIAISEAKATAASMITDAVTGVLLKQLPLFGIPIEVEKLQKYVENNGLYSGAVFDNLIWNGFCFVLNNTPGFKRAAGYFHHYVRVSSRGLGVGTPLTQGSSCKGKNKGVNRGMPFQLYSYPDLIVGKRPLDRTGRPQQTFLDGEFKASSWILLKDYVIPKPRKYYQLKAINTYAAKHTQWKVSLFVVGVENTKRNTLKKYFSKKQEKAAKTVLLGIGAANRVVNLYVPIFKPATKK